jgi:hypothetical protein
MSPISNDQFSELLKDKLGADWDLLLTYIKFQTRFPRSLLELTRMVRETLFTRRPLIDLLSLSSSSVSKLLEPEVIQNAAP